MASMCKNNCGRQARYAWGICRTCRNNQPKEKYVEYIPDYSTGKITGVVWHDKKPQLLGQHKERSVYTVDMDYKKRECQQKVKLKKAKRRGQLKKNGSELPDNFCDYFGV